ncbi:MAG: YbjN domain-containing protein [Rhodospirillales bacterium]|nr:YbjN domain-containing protein [Rhodospirillales bacterium]
MRASTLFDEKQTIDPLDVVERVVTANDWMFDRRSDQEMAAQVPGHWCDYSLYFAWNEEVGALHFTCAFDMRVPPEKKAGIGQLLCLVNERMWLGHFGMWEEEGLPMYRHALPLRGTGGPTPEQLEDLLDNAVAECERFYPAFQFVIWGGKSPQDALSAAMVETVGEA